MERMIRVDFVGRRGSQIDDNGSAPKNINSSIDGDPKLSVFIGNLDFASKEEDLRVFFEGIMSAERGPPELGGSDEGASRSKTWVTRVRIVRDKDTQLGKGFGYVQFAVCSLALQLYGAHILFLICQDRQCVDEILALEQDKLKFAKRKLRVQRCKTLPGSRAATVHQAPASESRKAKTAIVQLPKGDPLLGDKLAHLSKDERKKVKSSDADRVARRLAKKKARMALGTSVKRVGEDRDRVRRPSSLNKAGAPPKNEKKRRVRSDNSIAKRNGKK